MWAQPMPASTRTGPRAPKRSRSPIWQSRMPWVWRTPLILSRSAAARWRSTGDFVLTDREIAPVMKALREHGIGVTALHDHVVGEEPRVYFMHFWAHDDALKLAAGLKAAPDHINIAKS